MMYLALTYDHRLLDGREAVTFLVKVCHNEYIHINLVIFADPFCRSRNTLRTLVACYWVKQEEVILSCNGLCGLEYEILPRTYFCALSPLAYFLLPLFFVLVDYRCSHAKYIAAISNQAYLTFQNSNCIDFFFTSR